MNDDDEACDYAFDELRYRLDCQSDTAARQRALRKLEEAEILIKKVLMQELQKRCLRHDDQD